MNRRLMEMAETYINQRRRRVQLLRTVTALALVVAMCTSYVLILPGLTLAAEVYCGQEEHVHTADCYVDTLSCLIEPREATTVVTEVANCSFVPHVHTADCRNAAGELCCGYWDQYIHVHDEFCYDSNGVLICKLKETPLHKHTDACYTWNEEAICGQEENAGHVHTDACYVRATEPTCGLEENDGHHHDANCTVQEKKLICAMTTTDTDIHEHTDACYEIVTTYTCGMTEGEGAHKHTDDCYPLGTEPTCGLEMGEGAHEHTEACYEKVRGELTCTKYPEKVHTHSASCVDQTTGYYICGYVEVLMHQHTADCVKTVVAEDAGHQHTADCYTTTCVCDIPEHIHNDECYVEKTDAEETAEPTPEVTPEATVAPTEEVTEEPTAEPTVEVTEEPSAEPTVEVTEEPTAEPTPEVTEEPTAEPTPEVTEEPTAEPTVEPTPEVTEEPTAEPTVQPTATPEGTDYTEEEWEYINAILNGTAPAGMGDIGFFGLDDPAVYAGGMYNFWYAYDIWYGLEGNYNSWSGEMMQYPNWTKEQYCDAFCRDLTITSFNFTQQGKPNYNDYQYNYALEMKFDISAWYINKYTNEANAWSCDFDNYNPRDITFPINGFDPNWSETEPAFQAKYVDGKLKIWFTEEYRNYISNQYLQTDKDGKYKNPNNISNGALTMAGQVTKEDIGDEERKNNNIVIGVPGENKPQVTIKPDQSQESITNAIDLKKSQGTIDLQAGTLNYEVKVSSKTGNTTSFVLTDTVQITSNNENPVTPENAKISKVEYGSTVVDAVPSSAEVSQTGTCACGKTDAGFHIHYQVAENRRDITYQIPPLDKDKELKISYQYELDKNKLANGNLKSEATNTITAETNGGSNWDVTNKENKAENNVTIKGESQLKKNGWYPGNGEVRWNLTINSNYVDISGKTLTDDMLNKLVDADGNLIFDANNADGSVTEIKATKTNNETVTITKDNYKDYFDVSKDNEGKVSLTFKEDLGDLKDSKFEIAYKTQHQQTEENQTVKNEASFDGVDASATVTVNKLGSMKVTKTSTTTALQPDENGKSTLTWSSTYQFPTSGKYALEFSDEIVKEWYWNGEKNVSTVPHWYTKAQMEELLGQLNDIIQLYEETDGAVYELYVITATDNEGNNYKYDNLYQTNDADKATQTVSLSDDTKYYGFQFKTTKGEVQLTTDAEDGLYKLQMNYSSTAEFSEKRKNSEYAKNKAVNKNGDSTAQYEALSNDLVKKSLASPQNGKLTTLEDEISWEITIVNGGTKKNSFTLTDTLPAHFDLTKIDMVIEDSWHKANYTVTQNDNGDIVVTRVSGWGDDTSEFTFSVMEDVTTHQQTLTIKVKKNANSTEKEKFWEGDAAGKMKFTVYCKLDDDALESATLNNGTYTWDAVTNTVTGKFDDSLVENTSKTETNFTYTDESKQYKRLTKEFSSLTNNSAYKPKIKYTLDVNQGAELLSASSSTLTLTDTMSYDVYGQVYNSKESLNYAYLRKLTLDTNDIHVYLATTDEQGKPKLTAEGKLIKGAELSKDKWSASVAYNTVTDQYNNFGGGTYAAPLDTPVQPQKTDIITTFTIPDGMALIIEYEAQMTISVPTGATYSLGALQDMATNGDNVIKPGLNNKATLTGSSSYEANSNQVNNTIESTSGGTITSSYILTIQKSDADKGNVLLEGTKFELYRWDATANQFTLADTLTANGEGKIQFNYISDQRQDLRPNTAYYLVETEAVAPYELPAIDERPLLVFHVLAKDEDATDYPELYPDNLTRDQFSALSGEALKKLFTDRGIQGVPQGVQSVDGSGALTISMTNSRARRNITVEKAWANMPENPVYPDSVTVTLKRAAVPKTVYDAALVNSKIPAETWKSWQTTYLDTTYSDSQQMVAVGNWKMEFTKLEATGVDADGNALVYVYFVEEDALDHFTVTYDAPELGTSYTTDATLKLTNTYVPEMKSGYTAIALTKAWEGFDDKEIPDSVQVRLVKQEWTLTNVGSEYNPSTWAQTANVSYGEWQTVYKDNNWKLNMTDLPTFQLVKNNKDEWTGTAYTYTIEEKDAENKYSVSGLTSNPSDYFSYGITPKEYNNEGEPISPVKATLMNFKLGIEVEKTWEDGIEAWDTARPQAVNIYLKRYAVPEEDYNNLQFAGNYATLDQAKWEILRNSKWQDTSYSQEIALSSTLDWQAGVYGLEATGKDTSGKTVYYIYYIEEELTYDRVPGGENYVYTPSYVYQGSISNGTGKITITVTNTLQEVRKMSFDFQKVWNDVTDDKRPASLTVYLMQQEWSYNATDKTWSKVGEPVRKETVTVTADGGWKHSFNDLLTVELGKANGPYQNPTTIRAYTYTVVEAESSAFIATSNSLLPQTPEEYFEENCENILDNWGRVANYVDPTFTSPAVTITNTPPDTFDLSLQKIWRKWSSSTAQTGWPAGLESITLTLTQEYNVKNPETDADNWQTSSDQIFKPRTIEIRKNAETATTVTDLPKQVCVNGSWYDCRYRLVENPVAGVDPGLTWQTQFTADAWMLVTQEGQVGIVDPKQLSTTDSNDNVVTVSNVLPDTFNFTLMKFWENNIHSSLDWPSQVDIVTFELIQQYKEVVDGEETWVTNPNFADNGKITVNLNKDRKSHTFTELALKVFVNGAWRDCRYQLKETALNAGNDFAWHVKFSKNSSGNLNWDITQTEGEQSAIITPPSESYASSPGVQFIMNASNTLPDVFALDFKKYWNDKDGYSMNWPDGLKITLTLTQQYNAKTGEKNPETGDLLENWVNYKDATTNKPVTWTLTLDNSELKSITNLPKQVYIDGKWCDCRYILTENEGQATDGTKWELSATIDNDPNNIPALESCEKPEQCQYYVLTLKASAGTSSSLKLTNTIKQSAGKIELDITKKWSGVSENQIPETIELRFFYQMAKFDAKAESKKWVLEETERYDSLRLTKDANGKWQGTLNVDIFNLAYDKDNNNPDADSYLKVYTGVIKEFDEQGNELTGFTPTYTWPSGMPTSLDGWYGYVNEPTDTTLQPLFMLNYKLTEFPNENAPSSYYYVRSFKKPTAEGEQDNSLTITNYPTLDLTITKDWQIGTDVLPDKLEVEIQVQQYRKKTQDPNDAWGRSNAESDQTIVLDATNNWTWELKDLARYSANAEFQYTYAVYESKVSIDDKEIENAFYLEYQSDKTGEMNWDGNGHRVYLLTNATDTSATVNVTNIPMLNLILKKEWTGDAPENTYVYIQLKREVWTGEKWVTDKNYSQYRTLPNAENSWQTQQFYLEVYDSNSEIPWKNPDGSLRKYRYYIRENAIDNYLATSYTASGTDVFGNVWTLTKGTGDWDGWYCFDPLDLKKGTTETINTSGTATVTITNTPAEFSITKVWNSNFKGGEVLDMYLYLEYVDDNATYQPVIIGNATEKPPKVSFTDVNGQTETLLHDNIGASKDSELVKENGKCYVHIKRKVTQAPEGLVEWKITFSGLPKNATYRVTELEGMGYTVQYGSSAENTSVSVGIGGEATITNTPTGIKVVKQFVKVDDKGTPINMPQTTLYFTIMRQKYGMEGNPVENSVLESYSGFNAAQLKAITADKDTTVRVNEDGIICLTIMNGNLTSAGFELSYLPQYWYDATTQTRGLWKYTVYEQDADDGTVYADVSAPVNPETSISGQNTITVTNVVTDINVTKVWLAVDGNTLNPANLPDITLTLMQSKFNAPLNVAEAHRDDVAIATVTLSYDKTKVVAKSEKNGTAIGTVGQQTQQAGKEDIYWSYNWSNLPAFQENGEPYYYYVKETNPGAGWTQATDETANTQNPIAGNATSNRVFQITNEAIRYTLPETGGMGTLPYTAGGLLLMAAAAFLLGQQVKHRREDC